MSGIGVGSRRRTSWPMRSLGAPQHQIIFGGAPQYGFQSQALPVSALTVIKHRVSNQPLGQLRMYCREHLAQATEEWSRGDGGHVNTMGPVCPNCFVVVPSGTAICDTCGVKAV